jgi:hypothetical protein
MEDTVSEEMASESVSFENHGEVSKAQTRENFEDEELG